MSGPAGGIDPELVEAIRQGREELQGGHAKEGAHRNFGVKWAYWSFMSILFSFRITAILKRSPQASEVILSAPRLAVIQLGAGPAEDCIGLLEYLRLSDRPRAIVEYICIDEVDHRDQLTKMEEFAHREFAGQPFTLRQIQGDVRSRALEKDLPHVATDQVLLVLVANLLVSGSKDSESLTEGVAGVAQLALSGRARQSSCLILVEPGTQELRVEAVINHVCGIGRVLPQKLSYEYIPSASIHLQTLGIEAKQTKRTSIFACRAI